MRVIELFSDRQKKLRGEVPDVYNYDSIPSPLRVQVVHILHDALGSDYWEMNSIARRAYDYVVETLCREYGVFRLPHTRASSSRDCHSELVQFIVEERNSGEQILDAIELSFRYIDRVISDLGSRGAKVAGDAIAELNSRFRQHAVGYQFAGGQIIRVDSEFVHAEVVKPALALLRDSAYAGAEEEFLKAHEHYRHGKYKEALVDCLKAFESTMKGVCEKRNWECPSKPTAKSLINVCFDNGLIPAFWQTHFSDLRSTLKSGIPTARNQLGGHGQGPKPVDVPPHLVSYVLHMTAASIVFLIEAEHALKAGQS